MLGGRASPQRTKLFPNSEAWLLKVSRPSRLRVRLTHHMVPHHAGPSVQFFPSDTVLVDQGPTPRPQLPFRIAALRSQQIPISGFLDACPNTPLLTVFAASKWAAGGTYLLERGQQVGETTAEAPDLRRPPPSTLHHPHFMEYPRH